MARGDGLNKAAQKVPENAFKIELLGDMQVFASLMLGISLLTLKMMRNMMKI